jgi:hypothetical protein
VDNFDWFALGCWFVALIGLAAIHLGYWRPRSRFVTYALFAALGLALVVAVTDWLPI